MDDLHDLLDFGGKYQYLTNLYTTHIDHELVQTITFRIVTILGSTLAATLIILLLSPFGRPSSHEPRGCRRYGLKGPSRLKDELSARHTPSKSQKGASKPPTIHTLWLYPIKACVGIELEEAQIIDTGIKYDRQFCFGQLHSPFPLSLNDSTASKSAHQWRFITQREFPLLSQVTTELWIPDPTAKDYSPDAECVRTGGVIIVRFPYEEDGLLGMLEGFIAKLRGGKAMRSFCIPFEPTPEQIRDLDFKLEPFKIWKDAPSSLNMAPLVPPELKYFLGVRNPLALFRVSAQREIFRCAPRKSEIDWQPIVGFADAYPLNIMGLGSLQALSEMQPAGFASLSFKRFRGNIAVSGLLPFEEEAWKKIRIGEGEYLVCCRCVRCGVPNVDPATGVKNKQEPYKTLVSKRNVDKGSPKYGCLGMQMVPVKPEGWIRLGDTIEVLETGEHFYEEM